MKILIDPKLNVLIEQLSDKECAELLRCIFGYPKKDCKLPLWKYLKQQIDADCQKYKEKCDRMLAIRYQKPRKNIVEKSQAIEKENKIKIKENVIKEKERKDNAISNGVKTVEIIVEENFTFSQLEQIQPGFTKFLTCYPPTVIENAEKTMIKKHLGHKMSMKQLLEWLEQEDTFYNQNNKA